MRVAVVITGLPRKVKEGYESCWKKYTDRMDFIPVHLFFAFILQLLYCIICTVELNAHGNWLRGCRIGFFGECCDENDYIDFSRKWNVYSVDLQFVKFLIISWFVF